MDGRFVAEVEVEHVVAELADRVRDARHEEVLVFLRKQKEPKLFLGKTVSFLRKPNPNF